MKKSRIFAIVWIPILILYYPLYSYIDNRILHEKIKEAIEYYVSDNCGQKIQVTGFKISHNWAQEFWTANTTDPKVNDLKGNIIKNKVTLFKPYSINCSGSDSYQLNRSDRRFYPMFGSKLPPPPDGKTAFIIWIFLVFGGIVTIVTMFAYELKKKQENDADSPS